MIHLGLIGYPLEHSLSPNIHSAALQACQLEGDYALFPVSPDSKQGLEDLLAQVRVGNIHGLNVTIPHKQNVIPFLDQLTSTAQAIGAVNTIYCRNDKLIGDNTDADGFLLDLKRFIGNRESKIANRKLALILGAGGSARAVIYALINDGWNVTIAARRIEQVKRLIASFAPHELLISNYETLNLEPLSFNLVVNTTPVGMTPNINQSPWPDGLRFPHQAMVYDLIYDPPKTKFVKDAYAAGLSAITGIGMLIEQAALAFEIWTGCTPSRNILFESVNHCS